MKYYLAMLLLGGLAWGSFVQAQDSKFIIQPTETGDVFVFSSFTGQLSFNDGALTVGDPWNYEQQYSLAKFDTFGTTSWATTWSGWSNFGRESGLTMGPSGDLYMFGKFIQEITFDSIHNLTIGNGEEAFFLVNTEQNGQVKWAINTEGDAHEIYDIAIDENENIYLTGVFYGSLFINGMGINISPDSNGESFIAKLDSHGNVLWISTIRQVDGFRMGIESKCLSIAPDGDIVIVGEFGSHSDTTGAIMLDSMTLSLVDKDHLEPFLAVIDSSGNGKILRRIKGDATEGIDQITAINHDSEGNLYLSGYFKNYLKIDTLSPIQNNNHTMLFTAKMNADYSHGIWAKTGTSNGYSFTYVNDSDIPLSDHLYTVGSISGSITIDSTSIGKPLEGDGFLIKWNQNGDIDCALAMNSFGAEQIVSGSPNEIYVMNKDVIEQQINVYDTNCNVTRTLSFLNNLPTWSIRDEIEKPSMHIYPQPADDQITTTTGIIKSQDLDFTIFDLSGRLIKEETVFAAIGEFKHAISVTELPSGIYMMKVQMAERNFFRKVLIER